MRRAGWIALTAAIAASATAARADRVRAGWSSIEVPAGCVETPRPVVGIVVAATGAASATWLDCPPRPLACDAPIHEGDRVATDAEASVAFLADALHVQLGPDAELRAARTEAGAPELVLLRGRVRVLDREELEAGPRPRLATGAFEVAPLASDTELFVRPGPRGAESGVCEWARPVAVRALGAEPTRAFALEPGTCRATRGGDGLVALAGEPLGVSTTAAERCEVAAGGLDPVDVAAGPVGAGFPLRPPPPPPPPFCEAGACDPSPPPPPPIPVVEQPPGFEPPP